MHTISEIKQKVCNMYGVNLELLKNTKEKSEEVYEARWAISYILHIIKGKSMRSISNIMGWEHAMVVFYGVKMYGKILNKERKSSLCSESLSELKEFIEDVGK